MERRRSIEPLKPLAIFSLATAIAIGLSFAGFSNLTKETAKERQKGMCPVCGQPLCICKKVEGHHRVPQCRNGNNSVENCVEVHGSPGHDCHEILDRKAVDQGLIYMPDTNSFVPIANAPVTLFKSEQAKETAVRKFEHQEITPEEKSIRRHREKQHRKKHGYRGQGRRR